MASLADFAHINNYRELTFLQGLKLCPITTKVIQLNIAEPSNQKKIKDWQKVVYRVHDSITNDKFIFYKALLDVISLQFIKKLILRVILPYLIKRIDSAVAKLPKPIDYLAQPTLEGSFSQNRVSLNYSTSLDEVVDRIRKYFNENRTKLFDIVMPIGKYTWSLQQREKDLITIEKEVNDYFNEKMRLISQSRSVALPFWYHATKEDNFMNIINSGKLIQKQANTGIGVFFSTQDERIWGYGKYTFVFGIDQDEVKDVDYFQMKERLWVRVKSDIPVSCDSLAHIVVESERDKRNIHKKLSEIGGDKSSILKCPILTEIASDIICRCIQNSCIYTLPAKWKKHAKYALYSLKVDYIRESDIKPIFL